MTLRRGISGLRWEIFTQRRCDPTQKNVIFVYTPVKASKPANILIYLRMVIETFSVTLLFLTLNNNKD